METITLFARNFPKGLAAKMKAAAALNCCSQTAYLIMVVAQHVAELERNGTLVNAFGKTLKKKGT